MVTIEIDGPKNQSLLLRPLQRKIRGRFDPRRASTNVMGAAPDEVPSQRIVFDGATGKGEIVEPLHDDEHAALRDKLQDRGQKLPPASEPFECDAATFVHWMAPLVEAGPAKIVDGEMPAKGRGKPRTKFTGIESEDPFDKLAAVIENQTELLSRVLEKLAK